jgi:hypothetical protein
MHDVKGTPPQLFISGCLHANKNLTFPPSLKNLRQTRANNGEVCAAVRIQIDGNRAGLTN